MKHSKMLSVVGAGEAPDFEKLPYWRLTPSIPLNNPYSSPLYNPLYNPFKEYLDYTPKLALATKGASNCARADLKPFAVLFLRPGCAVWGEGASGEWIGLILTQSPIYLPMSIRTPTPRNQHSPRMIPRGELSIIP